MTRNNVESFDSNTTFLWNILDLIFIFDSKETKNGNLCFPRPHWRASQRFYELTFNNGCSGAHSNIVQHQLVGAGCMFIISRFLVLCSLTTPQAQTLTTSCHFKFMNKIEITITARCLAPLLVCKCSRFTVFVEPLSSAQTLERMLCICFFHSKRPTTHVTINIYENYFPRLDSLSHWLKLSSVLLYFIIG